MFESAYDEFLRVCGVHIKARTLFFSEPNRKIVQSPNFTRADLEFEEF